MVDAQTDRRPDEHRRKHRHLVVGAELDHSGAGVPVDQRAAGLERRRGESVEVQPVDSHNVVGVLDRPVDVAVVVGAVPADVRSDLVVQQGRVGLDRGDAIDHHRERLVADLDQLRGVARQLSRFGEHRGDRLAHVAGLADRHAVVLHRAGGLRGHLEIGLLQLTHLLAGQRGIDARDGLAARDVDRRDPRVGIGRAHEVHVALAVHPEVVNEGSLALQQALVLLARHVRAGPFAQPLALFDRGVEGGLI